MTKCGRLTIRPAHRCPPSVLAAVIAVQVEVAALVAAPPLAALFVPTDAEAEAMTEVMMQNPIHRIIEPGEGSDLLPGEGVDPADQCIRR